MEIRANLVLTMAYGNNGALLPGNLGEKKDLLNAMMRNAKDSNLQIGPRQFHTADRRILPKEHG